MDRSSSSMRLDPRRDLTEIWMECGYKSEKDLTCACYNGDTMVVFTGEEVGTMVGELFGESVRTMNVDQILHI